LERNYLTAVVRALAAALFFAFLTLWVQAGESMGFDLSIRNRVHTFASPLLTRVLLAITMLGWGWVMAPVGAALVIFLAMRGRGRQAMVLAAGALSAELVSYLLKEAFQRPRPEVFFGLPPAETYSFPSGHAFVGTFFYGLIAIILLRKRGRALALMVPAGLLLGLSRVYLGYHYPSDVLAGWTCAAAWLALAVPLIPE
jgi:undecaprenyl-diphosphatase